MQRLRLSLRNFLTHLASTSPILRNIINYIWNIYECIIFLYRVVITRSRYWSKAGSAPADQVIWIDPDNISRKSTGKFDFLWDAGSVVDGEWDSKNGKRIEEKRLYKSLSKRFEEGVEWENTDYYTRRCGRIETDPNYKYLDKEILKQKCKMLDEVYDAIKTDGYKTRIELESKGELKRTMTTVDAARPLPWIFPDCCITRHEVAIDIGRDGTLYWNEGRHRLSIAKILDIDQIPVRVVVRHREWQNIRNTVSHYIRQDLSAKTYEDAVEEIDEFLRQRYGQKLRLGARHPDLRKMIKSVTNPSTSSI